MRTRPGGRSSLLTRDFFLDVSLRLGGFFGAAQHLLGGDGGLGTHLSPWARGVRLAGGALARSLAAAAVKVFSLLER